MRTRGVYVYYMAPQHGVHRLNARLFARSRDVILIQVYPHEKKDARWVVCGRYTCSEEPGQSSVANTLPDWHSQQSVVQCRQYTPRLSTARSVMAKDFALFVRWKTRYPTIDSHA